MKKYVKFLILEIHFHILEKNSNIKNHLLILKINFLIRFQIKKNNIRNLFFNIRNSFCNIKHSFCKIRKRISSIEKITIIFQIDLLGQNRNFIISEINYLY